jgi:leucyl aminopeptidase (aminopeptidase T)
MGNNTETLWFHGTPKVLLRKGKMGELIEISKKILLDCLGVNSKEQLLIVTDDLKEELAQNLYYIGKKLDIPTILIKIPTMEKSGQEPPLAVAAAMKSSDVVICITEHSLTHTKAKKDAIEYGARVATMPGITREMFLKGAITADYEMVEKLTSNVANMLSVANSVLIEKDGYKLNLCIKGRKAIESNGRYLQKGQSGNLPSGEAYIAPVEGKANGKILVDGSIVGLGKLKSPILLTIENGLLIKAEGENAEKWLNILGDYNEARNVAEFGIGTNPNAILTGNILEDEKILGTIHVAFGSNITFGGNINAGVHLDAVVLKPTVYIDDKLVMEKGTLCL